MIQSLKTHLALATLFVSCVNLFSEINELQDTQDVKTLEESNFNDLTSESAEEKINAAKKTFADELDQKYANAERWAFTLANAIAWGVITSNYNLEIFVNISKSLISWEEADKVRQALFLILNTVATHFIKHGTKSNSLKDNKKSLLKLLAHSAAHGYALTACAEGSLIKLEKDFFQQALAVFAIATALNSAVFGASFAAKKIALHKKIKALKSELEQKDVVKQEPATE